MEYVTLRLGHFEINYGDAHFRRTDNGNALYNPFVGNYILDAFTTEIGGEVYVRSNGLMAMVGVTGGEIRGQVLRPDDRAPAYLGKLGFDRRSTGPARAADRLRLHDREVDQQHAVRRRPGRLALLLRAREHGGDRGRAVHLGAAQPRASATRSRRSR
jgi:hypothetical protein